MINYSQTNNKEIRVANRKTLKALKEADLIITGKRKTKTYSSVEELRKDLKV